MDEQAIARINALFHKSKEEGLTEAEAEEQKKLRADYIAAIRKNMRGTLNQVIIQNPDGTTTKLQDIADKPKNKD